MNPPLVQTAGLCAACASVRMVRSAKGSVFFLCEKSKDDVRYTRYPRLPILECPGFIKGDPLTESE